MKFIYPAVFHKTEEGLYEGYFPDLEDCRVVGDSLDHAIEKANDAANDWISVELEDEDGELPSVTDPEDIVKGEDDIIRMICVNIRFFEGWDE